MANYNISTDYEKQENNSEDKGFLESTQEAIW